MRFVLATALLAALASPSFADDTTKKKDASKDDAKTEEPPKCLLVRAADTDINPPVEIDYVSKFRAKTKVAMTPLAARTLCKSESNKPASEWVRDNDKCGGKRMTWKYTVTFGTPGKEEKFEQNVICAKKQ